MILGIAVVLLAGVAAGTVMGAAWAIRNAPVMNDEPSWLDDMDARRYDDE